MLANDLIALILSMITYSVRDLIRWRSVSKQFRKCARSVAVMENVSFRLHSIGKLRNFPNVRSLALVGATDATVQSMCPFGNAHWSNLHFISAKKSMLSDEGVRVLCSVAPNLRIVDIESANVTNVALRALSSLSNLRDLDLSNCGNVTGCDDISGFQDLKILNLSECNVVSTSWIPSGLQCLNITYNGACGDFSTMPNLTELQSDVVLSGDFVFWRLKELRICSDAFTTEKFNAMVKAVPNLEILMLGVSDLSTVSLCAISGCRRLKELIMDQCNIQSLQGLQYLDLLERLDLSCNDEVSDWRLLRDFASRECILEVGFGCTNIRDADLRGCANFKKLELCYLEYCKISLDGVYMGLARLPIKKLDVSYTGITGLELHPFFPNATIQF